jgi:outer membrane protein TolC
VCVEHKTGNHVARSFEAGRSRLVGHRVQNLTSVLAVGLGLLLSTSALGGEQAGSVTQLRGTTSAYHDPSKPQLRGATDGPGLRTSLGNSEPAVQQVEPSSGSTSQKTYGHDRQAQPTTGDDFKLAMGYLRTNTISSIMFTEPDRANSDRTSGYAIPSRGSLRDSMVHSANLYEGLRGSNASVGDTVALTLRGSYSTRAQIERAAADRIRVHGALTNFLPRVNATIGVGYTSKKGYTSFTNRNDQLGTGVEMTMPIYTSGVNTNTYQQAKHVSLASDHSYLAEEHRVALEGVVAHIRLRLNRRIEKTLRSNVSSMRRIAHIAEKLYEAGDASRTDIAIAYANVESALAEVDLARKTREETRTDYESVTGISAPEKLLEPTYSKFVPATVDQAVEMATADNPTLASSLHTALASNYAAKVERGRFGPKVDLYGAYNEPLYTTSSTSVDSRADWNVGVRLKMPLFDAAFAPRVGAARHEALEAQYRALEQSRKIERQVRRQWSAYNSAKRRVKIVTRQVKAVSISVEGARREYEAGFRSISDVLNDQVKLARARITLESARHEQMLAAYEIAFTTSHPGIRHLASAGQ